MITLYGSGPNFGLPDASPFVTKAETLLRMSKLPFRKALMSFSKAPKGKIPYIEDDGQLLGDSTLIRWHLEKKYGIDFDQGLTAEQLAEITLLAFYAIDHRHRHRGPPLVISGWSCGERTPNRADRHPGSGPRALPAPSRHWDARAMTLQT